MWNFACSPHIYVYVGFLPVLQFWCGDGLATLNCERVCVILLAAQCFPVSTIAEDVMNSCWRSHQSHSGSALSQLVFKLLLIIRCCNLESFHEPRITNLVFPAFDFDLPVWVWTTDLSFLTQSFNPVFVKHQLKDPIQLWHHWWVSLHLYTP